MQADPHTVNIKDSKTNATNKDNRDNSQLNKGNKKQTKSSGNKWSGLDQQVVFKLIYSLHSFAQTTNNTEEEKELKAEGINQKQEHERSELKLLQRNGIKRSDINEIIFGHIKPIPYSTMNDIRIKLRSILGNLYLKNLGNTKKGNQQETTDQFCLFQQSIRAYTLLSGLLKQASIPTPVQQGFYLEYNHLWRQFIMNHEHQQQSLNQKLSKQQKLPQQQFTQKHLQKLLQIWKEIPHQSLTTHLNTFNLTLHFSQLPQTKLLEYLASILVENKIQQCCTYYQTYFTSKYLPQQLPSQQIITFQDQILIPKITKSQHIFSSHVLSLFKSNPLLKKRLLNSHQLDPAVGVRIVDLLKQDGRNYQSIVTYCLKQHYKSVIYDHKQWWIVEDKLSFNQNFIQWYTQDFIKARQQGMEKNDKLQKIAHQTKHIQNLQHLQLSLLKRNKIIDENHPRLKQNEFKMIENPLYEKDRFDCSQLIIQEISPEQIQNTNTQYLKFQQYGFTQADIKIIDKIDQAFDEMCSYLLQYKGKPIGFDTQFRCVSTKYQQQGVSLIQLSTSTKHYIIDFLKLQTSPQFNKFIVQLLCNDKYIKVGHTISSDIKYLTYTLNLPQNMFIQSFVDITQIFKTLNPNEKLSSLSFLCLKFLNRKMSKYQQRSNWNRRPLRKAQIHYAALDAFACVLIYDKLLPEYQELQKHGKLYKAKQVTQQSLIKQKSTESQDGQMVQKQFIQQKQTQFLLIQQIPEQTKKPNQTHFIGDIHRSQSLVYHKKFEKILQTNQPKFLVDNMLKKLSAIMRNCGLDAEYIAVRDYQLASAIAQKQSRIILTRDAKFFQRKDNKLPIYLIKEKTDSQKMFEEITQFFKIDLSLFTTLSRCVKCNGPELIIIDTEEAKKEIKFKYEDSTVKQFWRCTKCKQIYWEGGQFQRAKEKYANIKKQ